MIGRPAGGVLIALALAACAGRDVYRRTGGHLGAAPVRAARATALAGTGERLLAVADDGTRRLLLTDQSAWILRGAKVERTPGTRAWIAAAFIPAADGQGSWAVGLDAQGRLWRVRPSSDLEAISLRYGLGHEQIRGLVALGGHATAFLLDGAVALADGRRVVRYPASGAVAIAGAGHRLALVYPDRIECFAVAVTAGADALTGAGRRYPLAGVIAAGIDSRGDLYAATARAVYQAAPGGSLHVIYLPSGPVRWLTAAGPRVWFADDQGVLLFDDGPTAVVLADAKNPIVADRPAIAAGDGSLWLLGQEPAAHLLPDRPSSEEARWAETVAPIFARACSECHREGGKGGVDLSTAAAWLAARDEILDRAVHRRSMPPGGRTLSEDERAAISAWARTGAPPRR